MNTIHSPIVVAIALALYGYNVSPMVRAQKLYEHFNGDCMELDELMDLFADPRRAAYAATELPFPTAFVYVQHALERYGEEALRRAILNSEGTGINVFQPEGQASPPPPRG